MIRIEISDEDVEHSTYFPEENISDIMYSFEEMLRSYTNNDIELDAYIVKRADEIIIKQSN